MSIEHGLQSGEEFFSFRFCLFLEGDILACSHNVPNFTLI